MQARAPAPSPSRAGAATVALVALALVLAPSAFADPLPAGVSVRPKTVEEVQRKLADLRFLPRIGVDGIFGDQSRAAVIAFQKWDGLLRDGIPGPVTQRRPWVA